VAKLFNRLSMHAPFAGNYGEKNLFFLSYVNAAETLCCKFAKRSLVAKKENFMSPAVSGSGIQILAGAGNTGTQGHDRLPLQLAQEQQVQLPASIPG
jgi:hypothetical protein